MGRTDVRKQDSYVTHTTLLKQVTKCYFLTEKALNKRQIWKERRIMMVFSRDDQSLLHRLCTMYFLVYTTKKRNFLYRLCLLQRSSFNGGW